MPAAQGTPAPLRRRPRQRKALTNGLVALGSAAVLAIYATGFVRTEPAAASTDARMSTPPAGAAASPSLASAPVLTPTPTLLPTATPTAPTNRRVQQLPLPTRSASSSSQPATSTVAPTPAPAAALRDGSYVGTGSSRHGGVEVTVVVQGGAIVSAEITRCGTRYPCSKIAALPGQVVARQGPTVDRISGATDSVTAYRGAVLAALAKAR